MSGPASLHRSFSFENADADDDYNNSQKPQNHSSQPLTDRSTDSPGSLSSSSSSTTISSLNHAHTNNSSKSGPPVSASSQRQTYSKNNTSSNSNATPTPAPAHLPPLRSIIDGDEDEQQDAVPPPVPVHSASKPNRVMDLRGSSTTGGAGSPSAGLYRDGNISRSDRNSGSDVSSFVETEGQTGRTRSSMSTVEDHSQYSRHNFYNTPYAARNASTYSSTAALGGAAASPGQMTPYSASSLSIPLGDYPNTGYGGPGSYYSGYSSRHSAVLEQSNHFNPRDIVDDGDDGFMPDPRLQQMMKRGPSTANGNGAGVSLMRKFTTAGRKNSAKDSNADYDPVDGQQSNNLEQALSPEKEAEWMAEIAKKERQKRTWQVVGLMTFVVLAVVASIIGGVVGGAHGAPDPSKDGS